MWSHYAKSHTGMTIGYDFSCTEWSEKLFEISYSPKRSQIEPLNYLQGFEVDKIIDSLSEKSQDWVYEEEVR